VDFIDMGVGNLRWPTFNIADIAVSTGAVLLAWVLWWEDENQPSGELVAAGRPETSDRPS
jgi:signal peptidase II